jgi:hypothetical protein
MKSVINNPMREYEQIAKYLADPAVKIDKLAQYAQGANPRVPEFLALAEIKKRQSMVAPSGAAGPVQTVKEDLVRAASPQPMMPQGMPQQMPHQMAGLQGMQRPQGVAALPTGMGEEAYAGGGIVAFDDGGYVNEEMQYAGGGIVAFANGSQDAVDDPFANLSFEQKLRLMQAQKESGDGIATKSGLFKPFSPLSSFSKNMGALAAPTTSAQVKSMMPADAITGNEQALFDAEALAKKIAPKGEALPTVGERGRMAPTTKADLDSEGKTKEPKEDMYAKYEEMFKNQAADSKAARQQDKYMRLLEAGLGIMGGTSQHALTNIGQGSMAAAKGYAQDRADYRKEDRQNVMDLMSLGMKKEDAARETEKLAIMRKEAEDKGGYYGAYGEFLKSKGANLGNASETAMDKANLAAIGKMHSGLLKEAGKMGSPYYGKSAEELWQLAQGLVLKGGAGVQGPTTVQWGNLATPPKS